MPASSAAARRPSPALLSALSPARALTGTPTLPQFLRWWVLVCVVSLLGFQSLGLVHKAFHGGSVAPRVVLAATATHVAVFTGSLAADASTTADTDSVNAADRSANLSSSELTPTSGPNFGHTAGSSDCQLLDQLSTALGPIAQALAWTALLPDHPVATPQPHSANVAQVWRAPARAPPLA